jgi:hypothetical protein
MNIQVWIDDGQSADHANKYELVNCPACGRVHFVNAATGKLLSETGKQKQE